MYQALLMRKSSAEKKTFPCKFDQCSQMFWTNLSRKHHYKTKEHKVQPKEQQPKEQQAKEQQAKEQQAKEQQAKESDKGQLSREELTMDPANDQQYNILLMTEEEQLSLAIDISKKEAMKEDALDKHIKSKALPLVRSRPTLVSGDCWWDSVADLVEKLKISGIPQDHLSIRKAVRLSHLSLFTCSHSIKIQKPGGLVAKTKFEEKP